MQFRIDSDEGLPIRGAIDLPGKPKALVVVVHGFKGFRQWGFFSWVTGQLRDHGFAGCRFDMSRNGIGENPETFDRLDLFADDTYSIQLADLRAVVAHCATIPQLTGLPVFLVGHSRGGAVAILGARDVPRLKGIVTWSAISTTDRWDEATKALWRRQGFVDVPNQRTGQMMRMSTAFLDDLEANREAFDLGRAIQEIQVPMLVIHGERDETVPVAESKRIAARARDASLLTIASATHTLNAIHPLVRVPRELSLATEVTAHFVHAYV
jgi:pimeloyl-ACP methyl ester carboxylesterase